MVQSFQSGRGRGLDLIKDKYHSLRLTVSEARQLVHRTASHGMCSPYVTVRLVPGISGASHINKVTTSCQPRTLFPLFDETFDLTVPESISKEKTFLLFSVKDRGPLGDRMLLGEALVPLSEVERCNQNCSLEELQQVQLGLTSPGLSVLDILTAIETRK